MPRTKVEPMPILSLRDEFLDGGQKSLCFIVTELRQFFSAIGIERVKRSTIRKFRFRSGDDLLLVYLDVGDLCVSIAANKNARGYRRQYTDESLHVCLAISGRTMKISCRAAWHAFAPRENVLAARYFIVSFRGVRRGRTRTRHFFLRRLPKR